MAAARPARSETAAEERARLAAATALAGAGGSALAGGGPLPRIPKKVRPTTTATASRVNGNKKKGPANNDGAANNDPGEGGGSKGPPKKGKGGRKKGPAKASQKAKDPQPKGAGSERGTRGGSEKDPEASPAKPPPPRRGQKGSKSLAKARKSYEKKISEDSHLREGGESTKSDPPSPDEEGGGRSKANVIEESEDANEIQFLASQRSDDKDFDQRVTFDGDIRDRVAAVPLSGDAALDAAKLERTIEGARPLPRTNGAPTAVPTMAPPASSPSYAPRPDPEKEIEKALRKKKKKKGKKKGRKKQRDGGEGDAALANVMDSWFPDEKEGKKLCGGEGGADGDEPPAPRKFGGKTPRRLSGNAEGGAAALADGGDAPGRKKGKKRGRPPAEAGGKKRRRDKHDGGVAGVGEPSSDDPPADAPKRKRARGRKGEGGKGVSGADRPGAAGGGPKCPEGRASADPAPSPGRRRHVISSDENPRRVHNPLLRLPQFPDGGGGGGSGPGGRASPRIEDIPQAGELWNLADVHFADPDTWPISYLARVLGFDVPEEGVGREFGGEFDPAKVGRLKDESDVTSSETRAGAFGERIWKSNAEGASAAAHGVDANGAADDLNLSCCDPLWANILASYRGYGRSEEEFRDVAGKGMGFEDTLNEHCLGYARERGVLAKGAKTEDKSEAGKGASSNEEEEKQEEREEGEGSEGEESEAGKEEESKGEGECSVEEDGDAGEADEMKEEAEGTKKKEDFEGSDLNFRFGTAEDEGLLRSLAGKCRWKSHPRHDVSASLRNQGHFCIVAERTPASSSSSSSGGRDKGVVAFLQYRFCWYRFEEKRVGLASTEKVSELVIFIDSLVYADEEQRAGEGREGGPATPDATEAGEGDGTTTIAASAKGSGTAEQEVGGGEPTTEEAATKASARELKTAKVLLTSLALVHAARAGIWYGMTEPPVARVPFFARYFRMSDVGRGGDDAGRRPDGAVPLAFDIKKCHFKYAILLLEETLRRPSSARATEAGPRRKDGGVDGGERMIVHLNNIGGGRPGVLSDANAEERSSRRKEKRRAHVRLTRKSNAESPNDVELFSVRSSADSASAERSEEEEAAVRTSPIDPSAMDVTADWDVVRLFPLRSAADPAPGRSEANDDAAAAMADPPSDGADVSCDIFLSEIRRKQARLSALESSIEGASRALLSEACAERAAWASGDHLLRAERDRLKLAEYAAAQARLREAELAWQAQLDQDMDAVCDVCHDGEVTPENQIIFCDACNVAVHQRCYGIDAIPTGAYFCRTCTHFNIDKEVSAARRRGLGQGPPLKITRPTVVCELCPRRQGAFVEVQTAAPARKARWVHVGCAKWQGMNYVDNQKKDKIEDLTTLKNYFKDQGNTCCLCKSGIGALHPCRAHESHGCTKWLHLTCARSLGQCSVQHGENCEGFYDVDAIDHPPWTLACPEHSEIDPESLEEKEEDEEGGGNATTFLTVEQLEAIAASYPPEPVPPKPFNRMGGPERKEYWSDPDNLAEFFENVTTSLEGAKCALCEMPADPAIDKRCDVCGVLSHADCADPARGEGATCLTCRHVRENEDGGARNREEPRCHMCAHPNASGGPLLRTQAKPISMKVWKQKGAVAFQKSFFGKDKFCHALCGMWNPACETVNNENEEPVIDCTNIVMADGRSHVSHQHRCNLCGLCAGAKVDCAEPGCVAPGRKRRPAKFHVTCARQAGLEVSADTMLVKCFRHTACDLVFRARLEDMREIELNRHASKTFKASSSMTWGHAASLFHAAVNVLRTLGWAWRWAEWWVEGGDNWEPLLEPGQREEDMTEEELRIVRSTPSSRAEDARRCRLSAFGAALRNRDYDREEGDDREPLERALTAVISTRSLVGPLRKKEVEFFVTWLALAYRSRSPVLGFGEDRAPVARDGFCVHRGDGSPKYELGPNRPLPGKVPPDQERGVFEPQVDEPDDFLTSLESASPSRKKKKKRMKKRKRDEDDSEEDLLLDQLEVEYGREGSDWKSKKKRKTKKKRRTDEDDDNDYVPPNQSDVVEDAAEGADFEK